tara:strand:+ start:700 stop:933 length:234 start_codon:yes stop_codon:yes gene_type:complete
MKIPNENIGIFGDILSNCRQYKEIHVKNPRAMFAIKTDPDDFSIFKSFIPIDVMTPKIMNEMTSLDSIYIYINIYKL